MAKKKAATRPTAKPGSGEGKAPLVIALAFFVIATIAASVMAYTFEGANAAEVTKADDAKAASKVAEKSLAETEERLRLYQVAIGSGTADDIEKIKSPQNEQILRDDHAKIVAAINGKIAAANDSIVIPVEMCRVMPNVSINPFFNAARMPLTL